MKQQNDYTILTNDFYKQNVTIQKLDGELKEKDTERMQKETKTLKNSKNKVQDEISLKNYH